jgi:hypothetical protein
MMATYFILLDLKSRNRSIRLLSNPIPTNLLREKNQELISQSRTVQQHPQPANLLLISQQTKTPNKENLQNPTFK